MRDRMDEMLVRALRMYDMQIIRETDPAVRAALKRDRNKAPEVLRQAVVDFLLRDVERRPGEEKH